MKLFSSHHRWNALNAAGALLLLWAGFYVFWRVFPPQHPPPSTIGVTGGVIISGSTVAVSPGKKDIFIPNSIPESMICMFAPLAWIEGWLTGKDIALRSMPATFPAGNLLLIE